MLRSSIATRNPHSLVGAVGLVAWYCVVASVGSACSTKRRHWYDMALGVGSQRSTRVLGAELLATVSRSPLPESYPNGDAGIEVDRVLQPVGECSTIRGDPMAHVHAIVWLDHREARIAAFSFDRSDVITVHSDSPHRQIHRKSGPMGSGHAADDHHFFDEIVDALAGIREVLVAGPGTAKTAFKSYVDGRHAELARRIVGVEALDHPSDGELLAHARRYFKAVDQLGTN